MSLRQRTNKKYYNYSRKQNKRKFPLVSKTHTVCIGYFDTDPLTPS